MDRRIVPPLVIGSAAAAMAAATWGTWPDAIYDYGTHLYVPWRLTQGQRLYADVAYFYGPLSSYLNAGLFRLFGVGLWTLVGANLAVLAGVLAIIHRLAGTAAALVVVGAFAFGQYVGIGNYNWACPYCHEVTHGVALGLAAIAAVDRWRRTSRRRWLAAAGAAVGLCLLTKPEVSAAAVAAVGVGLLLGPRPGRSAALVAGPAIAVVAIALALLALHGGSAAAVAGVVGPWRWVVDRRVGSLAFYRQGMGTDDVGGNLRRMAVALAITAVPAAAAVLSAVRRGLGLGVAAVVLAGLAWEWPWAADVARPWPVLVAVVAVVSVRRAWGGDAEWATRAAVAVFGLGLLAKMILAARVSQYGFALAMPAAVALTDAAVRWGPALLGRGGRSARGVAVAFVSLVVVIHVGMTLSLAGRKHVRVGTGADGFWADDRGTAVNAAVAAVRRADTVLVAPQGLMVNYLARRPDPVRVVNLMPPEVSTVGEAAVLDELRRGPPAAVVLVTKDTADGGFLLTEGHHVYGRAILAWVRERYAVDPTVVDPGELRIEVLRRRLP